MNLIFLLACLFVCLFVCYFSTTGTLDSVTPLKISLFANFFNAVLDPILIFSANMGVTGAALATLAAEIVSAITFTTILFRKKLVSLPKLLRLPNMKQLGPLLKGGTGTIHNNLYNMLDDPV